MPNARNKKKKQAQQSCWSPDPSSPMHVICASCGFRIEASRALETGWSLSDITGLKYKFCPNCGKKMSVQA